MGLRSFRYARAAEFPACLRGGCRSAFGSFARDRAVRKTTAAMRMHVDMSGDVQSRPAETVDAERRQLIGAMAPGVQPRKAARCTERQGPCGRVQGHRATSSHGGAVRVSCTHANADGLPKRRCLRSERLHLHRRGSCRSRGRPRDRRRPARSRVVPGRRPRHPRDSSRRRCLVLSPAREEADASGKPTSVCSLDPTCIVRPPAGAAAAILDGAREFQLAMVLVTEWRAQIRDQW